ncbi:hypothetical protein KR074_012213 [Drosophila pseudoananassae]|nr:hypothetical protein KR074_012213 [Drosophila pseudoananassae]
MLRTSRSLGLLLRRQCARTISSSDIRFRSEEPKKEPEMPPNPEKRPMVSARYLEFREKLRRHSGPELVPEVPPNPAHEMEPLQPWPNSVNPHTGEVGGPAGPEPTRYGDWERKGRVTDF